MRINGLTLGEITYKTGLSKTTIHHHIKNIPKSNILKSKLRTISQVLQKRIADSRRGKSIKNYTFSRPEKWNPDLVSLIAHFLFDGDISRTACCYNNRNTVLIEMVKNLMKSLLRVDDFKLYKDSQSGVFKLCYFNVEIATFINKKSTELLNQILIGSRPEKIAFLRAFFDDEGCMTFKKNKRFVRGYQHSLKILELIHKLLSQFKVESKIDSKFFEIIVSRKENLLRFQKLINFTPGVTVNGARSNSIWKKSLEKRKILEMAISSYVK